MSVYILLFFLVPIFFHFHALILRETVKQTEKQEQAAEILMKRFQPDDENNISSLCFYSLLLYWLNMFYWSGFIYYH